jgi:uncharacterized RDD family membrane protein YckC
MWLKARPWLVPRFLAELFDRAAPFPILPIIAFPMLLIGWNSYFWTWLGLMFLWHLLRDSSPNRRSLGKKLFRLRVVPVAGRKRVSWRRTMGRRFFSALSQCAYCVAIAAFVIGWQLGAETPWPWPFLMIWMKPLLLLAFAYDVASVTSILLSDGGRRIEDFPARTLVVRETAYTRDRKACRKCGTLVPKDEIFCGHCGERTQSRGTIRLVE